MPLAGTGSVTRVVLVAAEGSGREGGGRAVCVFTHAAPYVYAGPHTICRRAGRGASGDVWIRFALG